MVGLCWRSMRLPTSHRAVLLAAAAALGTSAFAQMRPQGGSMPRQRADEGRSRSVEDRLLPDPWRAWRQGLEQARGALMLSPAQPPAFDALLRERDEVQRFSRGRGLGRCLEGSGAALAGVGGAAVAGAARGAFDSPMPDVPAAAAQSPALDRRSDCHGASCATRGELREAC